MLDESRSAYETLQADLRDVRTAGQIGANFCKRTFDSFCRTCLWLAAMASCCACHEEIQLDR